MTPDDLKSRRLVGLFLLGCILFTYPILSLFNRHLIVWGIPLLYFYVFAAWLLLVVLIFLITRFSRPPSSRNSSN